MVGLLGYISRLQALYLDLLLLGGQAVLQRDVPCLIDVQNALPQTTACCCIRDRLYREPRLRSDKPQ